MNMHKYEKIWLGLGTTTLLIFLIVVGISAFYMGNQPPSCAVTLDPEKVDETEPFDNPGDRKSTRLNSSHVSISYAVFCLKKKMKDLRPDPAGRSEREAEGSETLATGPAPPEGGVSEQPGREHTPGAA